MSYKQFWFHFQYPQNSINARLELSEKDERFVLEMIKRYKKCKKRGISTTHNIDNVYKMCKLWYPEYLI